MTGAALVGDAYARGRAQADCDAGGGRAVRRIVAARRRAMAPAMGREDIRAYLAAQWRFAEEACPDAIAETRGIADGFGLDPRELFTCMHAGIVADLVRAPESDDGCTAVAAAPAAGVTVAKNRDVLMATLPLQRVYRQRDPAWRVAEVVAVSSLGSSGCASSGINSAGLALADTQIATTDHGVGLLRYFVMSAALSRCTTVAEAVALIRGIRHAGGGSLVLGDATGTMAAVELGHRRVAVETGAGGWLARTNHFVSYALRGANGEDAGGARGRDSRGRLARVRRAPGAMPAGAEPAPWFGALLAGHAGRGGPPLCRHEADSGIGTISLAVYTCRAGRLDVTDGPPCSTPFRAVAVAKQRRRGG